MTDVLDHRPKAKPSKPGEWVTDQELIRRSGVPEKIMRRLLKALDANPRSGFPPKDKLWGDRRYWPLVKDYWDTEQRRKIELSQRRRAQ